VSSQEQIGRKLTLDEQTFQQLLESAYVLQRHHAEQISDQPASQNAAASDPLGEVVETQKLIQQRKLDIAEAAELIVEKARTIVHAQSAAIGIVQNDELIFSSTSGKSAIEPGTHVAIAQSSAAPVLLPDSPLFGKILLCPDVKTAPEINYEICRDRGIRSLILVPVQYEGKIESVLELASDRPNAFDARDVRLAELMASLLRDAIARAAEMAWKQTVASERATMLEAMDALQPQIERLIAPTEPASTPAAPAHEISSSEVPPAEFSAASFNNQESVFSSSRFSGEFAATETAPTEDEPIEVVTNPNHEPIAIIPVTDAAPEARLSEAEAAPASVQKSPWSSAISTRQWLETLRPEKSAVLGLSRQWHAHRANFYLALSALLLLAVLSGWGTHSSNGVSANAGGNNASGPQLSLFERSLVAFGLADPPPPQPNLGNPNIQVWIDLHTALYYCPGSPMYGKTAGGKFSLQRDAQLDQFEPANRQPCQ
jgi:putative methionine-R-sulfoxide reductase with GAF domain